MQRRRRAELHHVPAVETKGVVAMLWAVIYRHARRAQQVSNEAVARKLYEICTQRGYVDDRDWREAADLLRKEREAASRTPTRPAGRQPLTNL